MDSKSIAVFAVDVGSVKKGNFGWCRAYIDFKDINLYSSSSIEELIAYISDELNSGMKVALGFECPLTLNLPEMPDNLTSARKGEGDRAWCASAGCGALAVGLVESAWILKKVSEKNIGRIIPTLNWEHFISSDANLFLWEAFVSSKAKGKSHEEDAIISVNTFMDAYPNIGQASAIRNENPYSMIGAAVLRAGLSSDASILRQDCIVVLANNKSRSFRI